MTENIFSTLLFWSAFAYSAGPFWSAVMQSAPAMGVGFLYRQYTIYFCTGWLAISIVSNIFTTSVGAISPNFSIGMHLVGAMVILWLAFKVLISQHGSKKASFTFKWQTMCLLSATNPKVYLTLPIGALNAQFSHNIWLDSLIFWALGAPLFFTALALWYYVGRVGAKISLRGMSLLNVTLLVLFALYLVYEGYNEMQSQYGFAPLF